MIILSEQVLLQFILRNSNHMKMPFVNYDDGDVYSFLGVNNNSSFNYSTASGCCFLVSKFDEINDNKTKYTKTDILVFVYKYAGTKIIGEIKEPQRIKCKDSLYSVIAYKRVEKEFIQDDVIIVPIKEELFSRIDGLFETGVLSNKKVAIIGLGSGGSPVALELVKSGVQKFILIDDDRLEIGNVVRHICGVADLGRYKTKAVRDMMLDKNPHAEIITLESAVSWDTYGNISELLKDIDLVICATDNRQSKMIINRLCVNQNKVCLYGGAFRRAYGGQVLRVVPQKTICFQCFLDALPDQAIDTEISNLRQVDNIQYSDVLVPVEPGLSIDIAPISTFIAKLAIMELLKDQNHTFKSLYEDFDANLYLWLNRREQGTRYEQLQPLEYNVNGMHIMRWYGVDIERFKNCPVCGETQTDEIITLDELNFFESEI